MRSNFWIVKDFHTGEVFAEQADPYAWIDPFAEIEHWATKASITYEDMRLEIEEMRRRHAQENSHIQAAYDALLKAVCNAAAFSMPPIIIAKPPHEA